MCRHYSCTLAFLSLLHFCHRRYKGRIYGLTLLLTLSTVTGLSTAQATLTNQDRYFFDTATGMYWYDPGLWQGVGRLGIDQYQAASTIWRWATTAEVDALIGKSSAGGVSLETVMGPRTFTLTNGFRWTGYHSNPNEPSGWIAATQVAPFDTITSTSFQFIPQANTTGAWLVSDADPANNPDAVLEEWGPNGEFFVDHETGLFWYDPATFLGQTRGQVDVFVNSNPIWEWATINQIEDLTSKETVTGASLETVMGPRTFTLTNGFRWTGYHSSPNEPSGWIVATHVAPFDTITSTSFQFAPQANNAGAWLVSTVDPVPEPSTLFLAGIATVILFNVRSRSNRTRPASRRRT